MGDHQGKRGRQPSGLQARLWRAYDVLHIQVASSTYSSDSDVAASTVQVLRPQVYQGDSQPSWCPARGISAAGGLTTPPRHEQLPSIAAPGPAAESGSRYGLRLENKRHPPHVRLYTAPIYCIHPVVVHTLQQPLHMGPREWRAIAKINRELARDIAGEGLARSPRRKRPRRSP